MYNFTKSAAELVALAYEQAGGELYIFTRAVYNKERERVEDNVEIVETKDVSKVPHTLYKEVFTPQMYHTWLSNRGRMNRKELTNFIYNTVDRFVGMQMHTLKKEMSKQQESKLEQYINRETPQLIKTYIKNPSRQYINFNQQTKQLQLEDSDSQYTIVGLTDLIEDQQHSPVMRSLLECIKTKTVPKGRELRTLSMQVSTRIIDYLEDLAM